MLICFEWVKRIGDACIHSEMLCCSILSPLFLIPNMTLKNFKAETRVGRLISGEDLISVKVTRGGFSFFSLSSGKDKRGHIVAGSLKRTYDYENICSVRVCRGQLPPVLNVAAQIAEAGSAVSGLSASTLAALALPALSLSPSPSPLSQGRDGM